MVSDPGIRREPSRADSKFSHKSYLQRTMNGYLAVQRISHQVKYTAYDYENRDRISRVPPRATLYSTVKP